MRAMAMTAYDSGLSPANLPAPEPGDGELCVRVSATSLNRFDVLAAKGFLQGVIDIFAQLQENGGDGARGRQHLVIGIWGHEAISNGPLTRTVGSLTFPTNAVIAAGGYLVVANDAAHLITNYPGLNTNNTLGNYGGSLANDSERIALTMPPHPAPEGGGVWWWRPTTRSAPTASRPQVAPTTPPRPAPEGGGATAPGGC